MIMFDAFKVICEECGGESAIGVTDTFDGDAVVTVVCNICNEIEEMRTEIREVE